MGGTIAGAIVFSALRMRTEQPLTPNRRARKVGQVIVGLAIGLLLQRDQLDTITAYLPIFIGLPLSLMIAGGLIGWLYCQLEKTDLLTAILATSPGNIGVMASIAADYGRNPPLVSLVQLLRFSVVIVAMPMVANVALANAPHHTLDSFFHQLVTVSPQEAVVAVGMLAIATVTAYIGTRMNIPIAPFLGSIAVGIILDNLSLFFPNLIPMDLHLPLPFSLVGQVLLGITIGEYWGLNPPLQAAIVGRSLIPVGLMAMAATAIAGLIHLVTAWPWLTCLLMASPGGSPEMIWIALTLHQDTELITTGHIIRLLMINLSLPLLLSCTSYFEARRAVINLQRDQSN